MKKITGIAIAAVIALTVFAGCKQTSNDIVSLFEPIIGTWENSVLGTTSTLVFNADKTCTDTFTFDGIGNTDNGTWDATDSTITRVWADDSVTVKYYTFNADGSEMTLSDSPDGASVTYTEQ